MLGLGSNLIKAGTGAKGIVTDNLVLRHGYAVNPVQPLSSGAASFDGDDDYIELGSQSGDLRLSGSPGSVTAWINPTITGDTYQRIVDKSDGGSGAHGYALTLQNNGEVHCYMGGTNPITASTVLTAQKWYHLAWTWDGTNHKLYIDGVLDVTNASSVRPVSDTTNMRIGTWNHATAREYKGYTCNVGIFEETLSQAQVKSIMNKNYDSLSASEKEDLVSWWNLDSVIPDTTTLVYDNHHGGVEVLGSEEVTYPNFTGSDLSQWRIAPTADVDRATESWDASGFMRLTYDVANGSALYAIFGHTLNVIYKVTMRVRGTKADGTTAQGSAFGSIGDNGVVGNAVSNPTLTSEWQDYEFYATSTGSTFRLYLAGAAIGDLVDFDSISVKEINGNTGTLS